MKIFQNILVIILLIYEEFVVLASMFQNKNVFVFIFSQILGIYTQGQTDLIPDQISHEPIEKTYNFSNFVFVSKDFNLKFDRETRNIISLCEQIPKKILLLKFVN